MANSEQIVFELKNIRFLGPPFVDLRGGGGFKTFAVKLGGSVLLGQSP